MDWTILSAAALGAIALAITSAAGVLVPYGVSLLNEKILSSRNARVTAAAATVAAELDRGLIATMASAVSTLRFRMKETLTALGDPSDEVLIGLITKGRKAVVPCP